MSGGVDSAVAAALMQEAGYRVIGVTLTLWKDEQDNEKPWQDRSCCKVGLARHVAKQLSIPHHSIDIQAEFQREIIDDFCDTYLLGQTPNPCVRCNERMKFGRLLEAATALGADAVATGHYARIQYRPETSRYALFKGCDGQKDQSYFLYRLSQAQRAATLFPLGEMEKTEVYQRAAQLGLPYEDILESQEVCFVTQKGYREFLLSERPEAHAPGQIVAESGEVLGEHGGVALYTIGQRHGLGIAARERLYVTRLDPEKRQVVVGTDAVLFCSTLICRDLVWGANSPDGPIRVAAKIRYRAVDAEALLIPQTDGRVRLQFTQPQRGCAPGQSVVFYRGDEVVGGGVMTPDVEVVTPANEPVCARQGGITS
jgi:tRNA-specific 2-thiouridylase